MKKLLFLLAFCAILMTGMAQPATSLAIQSAHHEHFWLYLNGTLQNQDAVESIKVSNLAPETYTVRIIIENRDYTEGTLQLQLRAGSNNYEMDYSAREQRLSLNNVDYEIHAAVQMTAAFTQLVQTMFEMQARDEREMHADHRHDDHHGDHHCDGHHSDHHGDHIILSVIRFRLLLLSRLRLPSRRPRMSVPRRTSCKSRSWSRTRYSRTTSSISPSRPSAPTSSPPSS